MSASLDEYLDLPKTDDGKYVLVPAVHVIGFLVVRNSQIHEPKSKFTVGHTKDCDVTFGSKGDLVVPGWLFKKACGAFRAQMKK